MSWQFNSTVPFWWLKIVDFNNLCLIIFSVEYFACAAQLTTNHPNVVIVAYSRKPKTICKTWLEILYSCFLRRNILLKTSKGAH